MIFGIQNGGEPSWKTLAPEYSLNNKLKIAIEIKGDIVLGWKWSRKRLCTSPQRTYHRKNKKSIDFSHFLTSASNYVESLVKVRNF